MGKIKRKFKLDFSEYESNGIGIKLPDGTFLQQHYEEGYYFWQVKPIDDDKKVIKGSQSLTINFMRDANTYRATIYIAKIDNLTGKALQLKCNNPANEKYLYPIVESNRLAENPSTCDISIQNDQVNNNPMKYLKVVLKITTEHFEQFSDEEENKFKLGELFPNLNEYNLSNIKYTIKFKNNFGLNLSIDFGTSAMVAATSNVNEGPDVIDLVNAKNDLYEQDKGLCPVIFEISKNNDATITLTSLVNKSKINNLDLDNMLKNLKNFLRFDLLIRSQEVNDENLLQYAFSSLLKKGENKANLENMGEEKLSRINSIRFAVPNTQVSKSMRRLYESLQAFLEVEYRFNLKDKRMITTIAESDAVLTYFLSKNREMKKEADKVIIFDIGAGTADITIAENLDKDSKYYSLFKSCTMSTSYAGNYFDYLIAEFLYSIRFSLEKKISDEIKDIIRPTEYLKIQNSDDKNKKMAQEKMRLISNRLKIKDKLVLKEGICVSLHDLLCYIDNESNFKWEVIPNTNEFKLVESKNTNTSTEDEENEKSQLLKNIIEDTTFKTATKKLLHEIKKATTSQLKIALQLSKENTKHYAEINEGVEIEETPTTVIVLSGRGAKWGMVKKLISDYCEEENNYKEYGLLKADDNTDPKLAVVQGVAQFTNWRTQENQNYNCFHKNTFPLLNYYMFVIENGNVEECFPLYLTNNYNCESNSNKYLEKAKDYLNGLNDHEYKYHFIISTDNSLKEKNLAYDEVPKLQEVKITERMKDLWFGYSDKYNHLYGLFEDGKKSIFPPDKDISNEVISQEFKQSHWPQIVKTRG